MKLRKHKNNKLFTVKYQLRYRTASGKERATPKREFRVESDSKGGALRAFRFGFDVNNTTIFSIAESPL